jgi:hypothetical protein
MDSRSAHLSLYSTQDDEEDLPIDLATLRSKIERGGLAEISYTELVENAQAGRLSSALLHSSTIRSVSLRIAAAGAQRTGLPPSQMRDVLDQAQSAVGGPEKDKAVPGPFMTR